MAGLVDLYKNERIMINLLKLTVEKKKVYNKYNLCILVLVCPHNDGGRVG